MNKVDMGIEVARVLGEIREKVSKDLDAIFESVVKDKLKSEYESNLDTNIYVIVERKTLKSLASRVKDIESRIKVANDELDDAENSINEARYSVSDIDNESSVVSDELKQILKESEVKSEQE